MIKTYFTNLATKFKNLTPTTQGLVVIAVLLVIGIILRWEYIVTHVKQGFDFFGK